MRCLTALFLFALVTLTATAQVHIGCYSRDSVIATMPAYAQAQADMARLREQYDAEAKRAETEFNAKYEEFLDALPSLAPAIRRKRQAEMQQAMTANVTFRDEARRLLRQAEGDALAPVQKAIDQAVAQIAQEHGLAVVLNTDTPTVTYLAPELTEDITATLREKLKN